MESEALIHTVEKRRCLYDKGYQNYCSRTMISAEWKKVANEVGCNEDEAKKRWKTLRDYFLKVSRESQKSGSAGGVKRKWFLFDRMLFLKSCSSDRKTTTNMATPALDDDTAIDDEELPTLSPSSLPPLASGSGKIVDTGAAVLSLEDQNQDKELETPIKKFCPTSTTPRTHKNPFPQQRKPVGDFEAELLEAAKRMGPKEERELNEEEHFFKNLIPKLQLMNPIDRMECQTEIQMVVLKYMKQNASSSACGNSHSDMHFQPLQSPPATDRSANDLPRYQYNPNNTAETSHNISNYQCYSQYRQSADC